MHVFDDEINGHFNQSNNVTFVTKETSTQSTHINQSLNQVKNDFEKTVIAGINGLTIQLNPQKIVISPGPGTPNDSGICLDVIRYFEDKVPILGICLGHQSIAQVNGASIIRAKNMMHGKTSCIKVIKNTTIFDNIPNEFIQTRYHSLIVQKDNLPSNILITAISKDDEEIMAIQIKNKHIYGLQFHPESIMSEYGYEILDNFMKI